MGNVRIPRRSREPDYGSGTPGSAVVAVAAGSVLVGAAAFVVSYGSIQKIVLASGVPPRLSALYPLMLDAMLVVACVTALALRGAVWWIRAYSWLTALILVSAMAVASGSRAAGISFPHRPAAAAVAVVPWGLLLLGITLCLSMVRHSPTARKSAERDHGPWDRGGGREEHLSGTRPRFGPLIPDSDPGEPGVRLLPPEPKPADTDPGEPAVRLLPPQPKPADTDPGEPAVKLLPHDFEA